MVRVGIHHRGAQFFEMLGALVLLFLGVVQSDECRPNEHGPVCGGDGDCVGYPSCVRCAHSGFCTATPLPTAGPGTTSGMDCGTVALCGVLALESGMGPGAYNHAAPSVHGLWPENGAYGTSECVRPASSADPTGVYTCYAASSDDDDVMSFEIHEWEKHGLCAGVHDADDFFTQVCSLARDPVAIMTTVRENGGDLLAMQSAVEDSGYEVFQVDTSNSQLYLSACATPDNLWKLSPVDDFATACGGKPSSAAAAEGPLVVDIDEDRSTFLDRS